MTNKKSAGNRVFIANLGKAGIFALNCGHRELKQIESLLGMKISELTMESVREIDCCLYCMVQRDAARKQVAMDKETFNAALDNMNAAQYLAAITVEGECMPRAFFTPFTNGSTMCSLAQAAASPSISPMPLKNPSMRCKRP